MPTRWEVTKAVRGSRDLPSPSKLIMLVLADVAEVGTAEIPARFTPSLAVLAGETGLGRSTVKAHLSSLDEAGWLDRTRPDARAQWYGERTRYRLTLPDLVDVEVGQEPAQGEPPDGPVGQDMAQGEPGDGPGVGQETDRSRPGDGHLYTDPSDQNLITTDRPDSRPDVEEICSYLAHKIEANGSKRPKIGKTWRDEGRRLLDLDKRTVEQVKRCIDWCQADTFWRANVLSMPTLRKKYDQLRLSAQRTNGNNPQRQATSTVRASAAVEAGRRAQALKDGTSHLEITA